jgi:hypothetical protein
MNPRGFLLFVGLLFTVTLSLYGHHSFAAAYQTKTQAKIEGQVISLLLRNPHTWLYVNVPDEKGQIQRWSIEWSGAAQLARQGVTRTTFKEGDRVNITGNPGRDPVDRRMLMLTITRPSDGFTWGGKEGEKVD